MKVEVIKREPASVKPNYKRKCCVCDNLPTVDLYNEAGTKMITHTDLCGVCTWGEADCADPDNWC